MSQLMSHSWPSAIAATMILASGAIVLLAALHDVVARTVPDWMSELIALCGIVAAVASERYFLSIGLGVAVFVVARAFWWRGLMGGADVKLLGAIAIVLPPGILAMFAVAMSLAGTVHAAVYILARYVVTPPPRLSPDSLPPRALPLRTRALRAERWRISRRGPLPYACAIAFGFLFVICNGGAP